MKKTIFLSLVTACILNAGNIKFNEASPSPDRVEPGYNPNTILSYHDSVKDVKQSVVNISTKKTIKDNGNMPFSHMFNDPFLKEFFGFNFGIPQERNRSTSSLGSGVIISSDGYIVTNNHVIADADEIVVTTMYGNNEYKAKVIGADAKTDLAVIKIEAKDLKAISFADSSYLMEGDVVFAVGNPFGVGGTITQGIVSALNKNNIGLNQYENFIQTDASINPGNSGGALVDSRGALVGINSAILSRNGDNNGIGFAIPSNMVKNIAQRLIVDGKIDRGYIGVMISNLTSDQKEVYKNKEGALISSVEKDMPGDKAGLKRGDLIIKVNDKDIKDASTLTNLIGSLDPNTKIDIKYERMGKEYTTKLKLANMNDSASNSGTKAGFSSNSILEGLSIVNLTDEYRAKYRIPSDASGVLVTDVKSDSKAENLGFMNGDLIIQVGDKNIKNIEDFNSVMKENDGDKVLVWINRRGVYRGLVIK